MPYDIIFDILLILSSSILFGEVFEQFHLPGIAGQLLSGLVIGPTILNILSYNGALNGLASISIFFIVFLIGLEMKTEIIKKNLKKALLLSITSFILPMLLMLVLLVFVLGYSAPDVFIISLAVSIPSISIISVIVKKYDMLKTEIGKVILSSVIISDILAFILLSGESGNAGYMGSLLFYLLTFFVIYFGVDYLLNKDLPFARNMLKRFLPVFKSDHISYGILIIFGLVISLFFNQIGLSYIIGAFFAGLIIHEGILGKRFFGKISHTFNRINDSFFIPMFFGIAGVEAVISYSYLPELVRIAIPAAISFAAAYLASYFLFNVVLSNGKFAYTGKRIAGIVMGRGAVGIAIAVAALSKGLISTEVYSMIIVLSVAISILAGILLRDSKK